VNIFELVSGTISMLVIVPLGYIAVQSMRESRDLRRIQEELTVLVRESKEISQDVHRLQRELRTEQDAARVGIDETQRTVEHVTAIVERTAEQVTDVASDTLALAAATPADGTPVAALTPDTTPISQRSHTLSQAAVSRATSRPRGAAGACEGGGFPNGARRDRTADLLLAKQALSQLSYGPAVRILRGEARGRPAKHPARRPVANSPSWRLGGLNASSDSS
jgi:hypothetical protein